MTKLFALYLLWRIISFNFALSAAWWANHSNDAEIIVRRRIAVYRMFIRIYQTFFTLSLFPPHRQYFLEKIAGVKLALDLHVFALQRLEMPTVLDDVDDLGDLKSNSPTH